MHRRPSAWPPRTWADSLTMIYSLVVLVVAAAVTVVPIFV